MEETTSRTPKEAERKFMELLESADAWLRGAYDLVVGSDEHDATCRRACLSCLLGFSTQGLQRSTSLDRVRVRDTLRGWW